jgi:hypothetical protein
LSADDESPARRAVSNSLEAMQARASAVGVAEFRELYYSHAGGYGQQCVASALRSRLWDVAAGQVGDLEVAELGAERLLGANTFIEVEDSFFERALSAAQEALDRGEGVGVGTRVSFVAHAKREAELKAAGFESLPCRLAYGDSDSLRAKGLVAMCRGRRVSRPATCVGYDDLRLFMDERDSSGWKPAEEVKRRFTYESMPLHPELWSGLGLPPEVERMMVEGCRVEMGSDAPPFEVPQYPFPSGEALLECANELNRGLCVGAFEFVPDEELLSLPGIVHPFTMDQKGDKWRACCDYKAGTNQGALSGPFSLCSPFDVRQVMKPSSFMVKYDLRDGFWSVPVHPDSRNRLILRHPITGRLVRACRLPFGFVDSPRAFCSLTESLAQILRRRLAGKGVHVYVFVDDFLLVADTEDLAREAGQALEDLLHEVGVCWAPHKQRGPCQVIEFLGLLVSNMPGKRLIMLTEKRQKKLRGMLQEWFARRPPSGESLRADPVELARLLGNLVFASQVFNGGRTYMQGMLSQFAGLEVDWKRGEVRPTGASRWGKGVVVADDFWRDLEWWDDHLETTGGVPLEEEPRGEAVVTGTDASDWGTGQLAWLDGQRAEAQLIFSRSEKGKSINWRELLGILRIVQAFGPELRGRCLLIETDNMSAKGAAEKGVSAAAASQELLRRLFEACQEYGILTRFTHTPGVKLVRPDQTSRGCAIEEPRVRLVCSTFKLLESRFGPFDSIIGGERRFALKGRGNNRLFIHPTHTTVATALRVIGERLMAADGERSSGVVVVPFAPEAKWWKLVRHFVVVGRCEVGEQGQLEMAQLGEWRPVSVRRAFLMLAFPHAAGALVRPVSMPSIQDGYVSSLFGGEGFYLPLQSGSFVYSSSGKSKEPGCLYRVWRRFDPERGEGLKVGEGDMPLVAAVELKAVRPRGRRGDGEKRTEYRLDRRSGAWQNGAWGPGSFSAGNFRPWEVSPGLLWVVDHLVQMADTQDRGRVGLAGEERLRYFFDHRAADRELSRARAAILGEPTPRSGTETPTSAVSALRSPQDFWRESSEIPRATQVAELLQAAGSDEAGAEETLAEARVSAAEAAAARRRPEFGSAVVRSPPAMAGGAEAPTYPCRYEYLSCAGCHKPLGLGTLVRSGGRGVVHAEGSCLEIAVAELEASIKAKTKAARAARSFEGAERRQVRMEHRLSEDRKGSVFACLTGQCGRVGGDAPILCRSGCGRGLHSYCAQISSSTAVLGNLVCCFCRADKMVSQSCSPPQRLVEREVGPMIIELTSGATSTHHGYADFVKLERQWLCAVAGEDLPAESIRLPHTNEESFISFLEWLVTDGPRARSFATTVVAAGGYMTKLELVDLTKSKRVKAFVKELGVSSGAETVPSTPVTAMMVKRMVEVTLPSVTSRSKYLQKYFLGRSLVALAIELGGGARVGEATGDAHGMLAVNTCIQRVRDPKDGDMGETIEMRLEDSKTYLGRHLNFVGVSRGSGFPFAEWLRDYWQVCGISVDTRFEGPFEEERPDYVVVRVSLVDMPEHVYRAFLLEVKQATTKIVAEQRGAILHYARKNREAATLGEERRYVNVAGGRKQGPEVASALAWMERLGWSRFAEAVKGPLLRASWGKNISHMPLEESGIGLHMVAAMRSARTLIEEDGLIDPEFDTQFEAVWGTHSLRRQADRVATRTREQTGMSTQQVNMVFGWELKKMREEMQVWYAGLDRVQRLQLARVTMMV